MLYTELKEQQFSKDSSRISQLLMRGISRDPSKTVEDKKKLMLAILYVKHALIPIDVKLKDGWVITGALSHDVTTGEYVIQFNRDDKPAQEAIITMTDVVVSASPEIVMNKSFLGAIMDYGCVQLRECLNDTILTEVLWWLDNGDYVEKSIADEIHELALQEAQRNKL